jgi:hypothetical protein
MEKTMAFDQLLAERVRKLVENEKTIEKKMFGGVGFLINGNMACGVHGENLIVRVGKERYDEILTHPLARPFDMTGKPMTGWVEIIPTGTKRDVDLGGWVRTGMEYARTLPSK